MKRPEVVSWRGRIAAGEFFRGGVKTWVLSVSVRVSKGANEGGKVGYCGAL